MDSVMAAVSDSRVSIADAPDATGNYERMCEGADASIFPS